MHVSPRLITSCLLLPSYSVSTGFTSTTSSGSMCHHLALHSHLIKEGIESLPPPRHALRTSVIAPTRISQLSRNILDALYGVDLRAYDRAALLLRIISKQSSHSGAFGTTGFPAFLDFTPPSVSASGLGSRDTLLWFVIAPPSSENP